jgi:hypothetical protein
MINAIVTLSLVVAVKLGFLWVFVPKHQRLTSLIGKSMPVRKPPGVESHDGHEIGPSLRSDPEGPNRLKV